MRARIVDWTLLTLVLIEVLSGLGSFLIGRPEGRFVFILKYFLANLAQDDQNLIHDIIGMGFDNILNFVAFFLEV